MQSYRNRIADIGTVALGTLAAAGGIAYIAWYIFNLLSR